MAQIYYDPTGGFLYGIDSNGNPEIVKTDACVMMPENVFVDNLGKIHVKDLQGLDTCISDGQGNDAIIMGPIGPQGPAGPQGPQGPPVGISTIIPSTNNVTVVFTDGEQIVVNHGKDGTSIKLISSLSELPQQCQIGDSCLLVNRDYDQTQGHVDAGSLYEYTGNVWAWKGNIKGPKGEQGPQGEKGEAGDSYLTQPVADKLTTIAGEYDNVKQEVDNCTAKLRELENRITVLEGYITQLNSIDLSGLAVAYPKTAAPEEA